MALQLMGEFLLRCNTQKCRVELTQAALVTCCSYVSLDARVLQAN
jgi:hypothetical protein